MDRVEGEQGRDHRAWPSGPRHEPERQKKQHSIGRMQEHVSQMEAPWADAEELRIDLERKPGKWVPVSGIEGGERPVGIVPVETAKHMRVTVHVRRIIQGEKTVPTGSAEQGAAPNEERDADENLPTTLG